MMGWTPQSALQRQGNELLTDASNRPSEARYDQIAEWYVAWIGDSAGLVCDPASEMLPTQLDGQRWLDLACGAGRTARELARRGASVTGIDLSVELISVARAGEPASPVRVRYAVGDSARPTDWWDGELFDGAVCEMALMDIDDLVGTVGAVGQVLRPGGRFLASFVNPCFPGNEAGLSSWPPEHGYATEGFWTSPQHRPEGVRSRVGSNHRMITTYLNAFIEAGFHLERAYEPPTVVPYWLVLAWRR